jgi:tetratricopeptide (TPR) repeat protein
VSKHEKASEYAKKSIQLILNSISKKLQARAEDRDEELYKLLYLGYYNLGVEYEHLGNRMKAIMYLNLSKKINTFTFETQEMKTVNGKKFLSICNNAEAQMRCIVNAISSKPRQKSIVLSKKDISFSKINTVSLANSANKSFIQKKKSINYCSHEQLPNVKPYLQKLRKSVQIYCPTKPNSNIVSPTHNNKFAALINNKLKAKKVAMHSFDSKDDYQGSNNYL